jgi:hypothetical protein
MRSLLVLVVFTVVAFFFYDQLLHLFVRPYRQAVELLGGKAKVNSELVAQQSGARAVSLLGRTVTYPASDGVSTSGVVEKVEWSDGIPSLTVAGLAGIDPNSVTAVQ